MPNQTAAKPNSQKFAEVENSNILIGTVSRILFFGDGLPNWYLSEANFITGISKYATITLNYGFFSVFWNKWPIKFDFRSDDTLNASNATIPHFTVNLREEWGCRSFLISLSVHAIVENGKLQNGKSMTILDERCKYRIGSALHVYAVVFAKVAQMEIQPEHIKWNSNFNKIVWHFRSKSFVWTWEVD